MKKAPRRRPERLAALIKETLAEALRKHVKDPRAQSVTLTRVTVSPDGSHALVGFSVLGEQPDKESALEGLESAKGFLRSHLARELPIKVTPELHFKPDPGLEHAARIDRILSDLHGR